MSNLYKVNDVMNTIAERYYSEKGIVIPEGHLKILLPDDNYLKYG